MKKQVVVYVSIIHIEKWVRFPFE